MKPSRILAFSLSFAAAALLALALRAQQQPPELPGPGSPVPPDLVYRVRVDLVLLNVAVTDKGGHYITGLRPSDFRVYEDGITQRIATFSEGGGAPEMLLAAGEMPVGPPVSAPARPPAPSAPRPVPPASNIFVVFDTSNFMYRNFVFAEDAIGEFIRHLEPQDSVAVYGFSRNLLRACPLTHDRQVALAGLRKAVAGDDTSLYNSLLLTLQDAGQVPGRKVVVVFSNGPDNGSMISPEAVRELAESEGIPIYMISTQDATRDEISSTVFRRLTARTGGKAYFARTWHQQSDAFASIRADLAHLYALSYYPAANSNQGWRKLSIELVGENSRKYHIRTRTGYRPRLRAESQPAPSSRSAAEAVAAQP